MATSWNTYLHAALTVLSALSTQHTKHTKSRGGRIGRAGALGGDDALTSTSPPLDLFPRQESPNQFASLCRPPTSRNGGTTVRAWRSFPQPFDTSRLLVGVGSLWGHHAA